MANEEPVSNNEPSNKETKTSDPAMENVLASPQQTADGKGTTNPLSPIILEKDERASQAQRPMVYGLTLLEFKSRINLRRNPQY